MEESPSGPGSDLLSSKHLLWGVQDIVIHFERVDWSLSTNPISN